MSPYDFPPEYGIEVGERCGRNYCKGRMEAEAAPCICDPDAEEDIDCLGCTHGKIVVCGTCNERPEWDR